MALTQHSLVERRVEGEVVSENRARCPFYGMSLMLGSMVDSQGNQCALKTSGHSPCHMEMEGKTPDWNECTYRSMEKNEKFSQLLEKGQAFPVKFRPQGVSEWSGISIAAWFEHVMGRNHRQP